jgi:quinol monooxygenase YgiN
MSEQSEEIVIVAVAEAKPGCEAEVEAAVRACVSATRLEKGCRYYTAHTDLATPARFVFIERWADQVALATHQREPHFLAMTKAFETLLADPLQANLLRALQD